MAIVSSDESDKGIIKVKITPGGEDYAIPELGDGDYITIEDILPLSTEDYTVKSYITTEEKIEDCVSTTNYNDTTGIEMNGAGTYVTSNIIMKDGDKKDVLEVYNNFGDVPPTAYNIMKNPELWTLLLAALMLVGLAAPIEIIRKGRARRLLRALPTLNIGTERFEI